MKAVRLALLELRRFRGPLRRFVPLVLILGPLLYGALYLWSNWDPYGRLNAVPVAVVNSDKPVNTAGQHVNAGEQFVHQLQTSTMFDWHFTSARDARDGLKEGRYYFTIEVPPEFSAKLSTAANKEPQRAAVMITKNDANGYVVGIMADTMKAELQNQINAAAHSAYGRSLYGEMDAVREKLRMASDTSGQLVEGTELSKQGTAGLTTSVDGMRDGAAQVSLGSRQVTDAAAQLDQQLSSATDFTARQLPDAVNTLVNASNTSVDGLSSIKTGTGLVNDRAAESTASLEELARKQPSLGGDPAYRRALDNARKVSEATTSIDGDAQRALSAAQDANGKALGLQQNMGSLQDQVRSVTAPLDNIRSGTAQLSGGSLGLTNGMNTLVTNGKTLQTSARQVNDGAHRLDGLIHEGLAKIPPNSPSEVAHAADVLGSPSEIKTKNLNPAGVYGRGLAPFFFAIALWVFGLFAYLLLKPVNQRALASPVSAGTIAVAGWLPAAGLGVLGGLVLLTVVNFGLGLEPVDAVGTAGLVSLAAATFVAIDHFLRTWLGTVGGLVSLVLLIIQITACGGLYPIETTPAPFQAIHPYVPMTYLVNGLRVTISGGMTEHLLTSIAVLGGFLVTFLVLTTFVVMRQRTWTLSRLHPQVEVA